MRIISSPRVKLALALLLAAAPLACAPTEPSPLVAGSCAELTAKVDACLASHCTLSPDDALCGDLSPRRSSLLQPERAPACDGLSAEVLGAVGSASCESLLDEMRASLSGKADAPCPPYFPWCEGGTDEAGYRVEVIDWRDDGAELEVTVDDVVAEAMVVDGMRYQALAIAGQGTTFDVGKPAIPLLSVYLGAPASLEAASLVAIEALESTVLTDVLVYPFQPWQRETDAAPAFAFDALAYDDAAAYPAGDGFVDALATWRNYKAIRLELHPVRYVAAARELQVVTRFHVSLAFTTRDDGGAPAAGEPTFAAGFDAAFANYDELAPQGEPERDDPERVRYLVVADDALAGALAPLLAWKDQRGLKTKLALLSEIVPEGTLPGLPRADAILQYLKAAYAAEPMDYLLLVGEVEALPFVQTRSQKGELIYGDHAYACLAGDDLLADVALGRLVGNADEVAAQVAKIIAYESGDRMATWRHRGLLVAHEEGAPGKYTGCSESIRQRAYASPSAFVKLYGVDKPETAKLVEELSRGYGVVNYRGHGDETSWWEWNGHSYAYAEQPATNAERTPVVFSIACLNAKLDEASATAAEQWVKAPAGGAVAFLGATKPSWTKQNHDFDRHLWASLLDRGVRPIGQLLNSANTELLRQYAGDGAAEENVQMYIWLGDPSLEIDLGRLPSQPVSIGWCNIQHPTELIQPASVPEIDIYAQIWAEGLTNEPGPAPFLMVQLGYGPEGSVADPGEGWTWQGAYYNLDAGNNDEYMGRLAIATPGNYAYAMRVSGDGGASWTVCDLDGSSNGTNAANMGVAVIGPRPQMSLMNARLDWPYELRAKPGEASGQATLRATIDAMTWKEALLPFVRGEIGFGQSGTLPDDPQWQWFPAKVANAYSGNLNFQGTLTAAEAGTYGFAFRMSQDDGATWTVADTDGSSNGVALEKLGVLRVEAPTEPTP